MSTEHNITCLLCLYRHPASHTCQEAKRLADLARAERDWRIAKYELSFKEVDETFGSGAAWKIVCLIADWHALKE